VAYICGMGMISPQDSQVKEFPFAPHFSETRGLACREPDYRELIQPRQSRRMSRVIKMGVYAALAALREADTAVPDAIITGTGLGCLQDTETFMRQIVDNQEQFLIPTPFIHSTHNTIGSQIALVLNCTGYNQTYAHKHISFESALLDGMLRLADHSQETVLVGGVDEMTPTAFRIKERLGFWKRKPLKGSELFQSRTRGTIAGEGAGFFCLSNRANDRIPVRLVAVSAFMTGETPDLLEKRVSGFLAGQGEAASGLGLFLAGFNGDPRNDGIYQALAGRLFAGKTIAGYKHLCGDFETASAFAVWLAASIIRHQSIPAYCVLRETAKGPVNSILIHNHFQNRSHSLLLLKRA